MRVAVLFFVVSCIGLAGCQACTEMREGFAEGWDEGLCEEKARTTKECSSCCGKASRAEGRFASGKCACVNAGTK